ncbi:hypothetical protein HYU07_07215 [Candidatus Woesearchaeota archaeon]|nr:hypothetical protein [Candidatus Woesearchaeota archaeon]
MINIAIPYKGESLNQVLDRLVDVGIVDKNSREFYIETIQNDKARVIQEREQIKEGSRNSYSSNEDVERILQRIRGSQPLAFDLKADYDLQREGQPARILFKGLETKFDGVPIRLVGRSHYDIPTSLHNHEVSLAFVGWDELYEDHIEELKVKDIRDWSGLNPHLRKGSTDVRILGSAGLDDFVGHFVMMHPKLAKKYFSSYPVDARDCSGSGVWASKDYDEKQAVLWRAKHIFVDHKYEKIYHVLFKWETIQSKFRGTSNVERAIRENEGVGIYVVQEGNAVKENGLNIVGNPLLISETVIAINNEDFEKKSEVKRLAKALEPRRNFGIPLHIALRKWTDGLRNNLGDNYLIQSLPSDFDYGLHDPGKEEWNLMRHFKFGDPLSKKNQGEPYLSLQK